MYFSLHSSTLCSFYRLKLFPNSHIIIHRIWQTKKNLNYPQNFHSNCHNKILATIEVPCNIEMNFFILENLQTFLHSKHIFWTKPIPCRNVKFSFSKMNFQHLTFLCFNVSYFFINTCAKLLSDFVSCWNVTLGQIRHPNANLADSVSHYNIE